MKCKAQGMSEIHWLVPRHWCSCAGVTAEGRKHIMLRVLHAFVIDEMGHTLPTTETQFLTSLENEDMIWNDTLIIMRTLDEYIPIPHLRECHPWMRRS